MIEFITQRNVLILRYHPYPVNTWVYEKLKHDRRVVLKRTFNFTKEHLVDTGSVDFVDEETPVDFLLGTARGEYYVIDRGVLGIDFDLYIHRDVELGQEFFVAPKNVSIFSIANRLCVMRIAIGGSATESVSIDEFKRIISKIPNDHELRSYVIARVGSVLREYVDTKKDGEDLYNKYLNKRLRDSADDMVGEFKAADMHKYSYLLDKLNVMLENEESFSETRWQQEIAQFLLLLYPRYIMAFEKVQIIDTDTKGKREVDFMLVDSSGNIDIVEIKKPFAKCIVTDSTYRDNHIPLRELSGSVMQIEKYIYHLCRWGASGEQCLTRRFRDKLPEGFKVKITNPKGLIIMGREVSLSENQRHDFEVIKRQYKNIVDIVSYDDLLSRLRITIKQLEKTT